MICRVMRRAEEALPGKVWVATDHRDIYDAVRRGGGRPVMTSEGCADGTSRVAQAVGLLGLDDEIIVNVQGDEPFLNPSDITAAVEVFSNPDVEIATLARRFDPAEGVDALMSPDTPKVTFDAAGDALYFSRSVIPYVREGRSSEWLAGTDYYVHVGLYAFRRKALDEVVAMPPGRLERAERLEQLRWLEGGKKIRVVLTDSRPVSIDTPDDLRRAREIFARQQSGV